MSIYGPTPTETIKQSARTAFKERNRAAFGDAAAHLLIRGYKSILGKRGGLSFVWVGATTEGDEHWQAVREQFSTIDWK